MTGKEEAAAPVGRLPDHRVGHDARGRHERWSGDVQSRAHTPEELETLFEDALVLRNRAMLADLFEDAAVLLTNDGRVVSGRDDLADEALAVWPEGYGYVADPRHVVQTRDIGLVVSPQGVSVMHRGSDGAWRYAIVRRMRGRGSVWLRERTEATMTQDARHVQLAPVAVAASEGDARWWFDSLAVIRATAVDTGGQMAVIEVTEPPGADGPLHVHHREDEGFWILEGSATIQIGDATFDAQVGDYVFAPRDIPHRYSVGPDGCRMLFLVTPGGFEQLVIAMSEPAAQRTLPPPADSEPDWERIAAIAQAHGCELLG